MPPPSPRTRPTRPTAPTSTSPRSSTGSGDSTVTYYVADVTVADATTLRAGFAENKFGTNIVEDTSPTSPRPTTPCSRSTATTTVSETPGVVIRNGVLYRDDGARTGLAVYADGTMEVYDDQPPPPGNYSTPARGNPLVWPGPAGDGEVLEGIEDVEVDTSFGNHSIQGEHPTAVGIIDEDHLVFVVSTAAAPATAKA